MTLGNSQRLVRSCRRTKPTFRVPRTAGRDRRLRSDSGPGGRTYAQLRNEAADRKIKGRSKMDKTQMERALGR
jgi:hypothetical protein